MGSKLKKWTILIYNSGNNDLAKEVLESKINLEKIQSIDDINVVMQIGIEDIRSLNIIRTDLEHKDYKSGVKRYCITNNKSNLIKDLNECNMSDPKNLYEFIIQSVKDYPAEKYMLILGGHGYGHVGTITDYSTDSPYIMGFTEMAKVIDLANVDIDIMVLDTCYANNIELIYEFGKKNNSSVKNIVTHIKDGPIEGINYLNIIDMIKDNYDTYDLIKNIVESMNLVGFKINHKKLKKIKGIINDLAYYNLKNESEKISAKDLIKNTDDDYIKAYNKQLEDIVIYNESENISINELIDIFTFELDDINRTAIYYKFAFAKNNYWTYVLSNKELNESINIYMKNSLLPIKLTFNDVYRYTRLTNYSKSDEEVFEMTKSLYKYKNWVK